MSAPSSPFFRPSTPSTYTTSVTTVVSATPGGTQRARQVYQKKKTKEIDVETKSGIVGTTANLVNAIVGSGIVGIPYSIYCSGLGAGVFLVLFAALLTLKSLRILIGTAQEIKAPSYEVLCEAAFGNGGFLFITANMFIMAYGAMVSYLMIVKDTIPVAIFGVDPSNHPMKRSILFLLSLFVMVPLSSQRDMASLAMTSRISVVCDIIMVALVIYNAPVQESLGELDRGVASLPLVKPDTLFIGLGVLSFAYVCQHSAFIIAGSLDRPNRTRWGQVTLFALALCVILATCCGLVGYLGYLGDTQGNILNNLPSDTFPANLARALLGSTMLFVYPMESFVARHVLVVTLFEGRRAHEGEDSSVLNRPDRRYALTLGLYVVALFPALLFENLGKVLSVTGAIGGSCLSYIGPGVCYLGVYGKEFLQIASTEWFPDMAVTTSGSNTTTALVVRPNRGERQPLTVIDTMEASSKADDTAVDDDMTASSSMLSRCIQWVAWYLMGMPVWSQIARIGSSGLDTYQEEQLLKSPHISRIAPAKKTVNGRSNQKTLGGVRRVGSDDVLFRVDGTMTPNTINTSAGMLVMPLGVAGAPPVMPTGNLILPVSYQQQQKSPPPPPSDDEEERKHTPKAWDFVVAVFYILFGILAMFAGLLSIYNES